jgi:two-component system sensor histidine kinase/response regulator
MSKIEAGRTTLNPQSFDLHRLLEALESMFHLRATNKGLQLIFDCAADVPQYVRTDESKLRQVLINLLSNAIKFTPEGGVTLRVRSEESPNSYLLTPNSYLLHFEVQDTGGGHCPRRTRQTLRSVCADDQRAEIAGRHRAGVAHQPGICQTDGRDPCGGK